MHGQRGFTLVELMIVVAVIGILAGMAIPRYKYFQMRAKRAEAFVGLKAIHVAQKDYFVMNGFYADNFDVLGVSINGATRVSRTEIKGHRYSYRVMLVADRRGRRNGNFRAVAWSTQLDHDAFVDVVIIENDLQINP